MSAVSCSTTERQDALLIHQGAIGDFLITLRLTALWTPHGRYRWSGLTKASLGGLGRSLGVLTEACDFDSGGWHTLFGERDDVAANVKSFVSRFGLIVNVLAGADAWVSRSIEALASGRVVHIDPKLPEPFAGHCWDHLAGQIEGFDRPLPPRWAYQPTEACLQAARSRFAGADVDPSTLVLIHPGAAGRHKRWPIESFHAVAKEIRRIGLWAGFLLGPVEVEQFSQDAIRRLAELGPVWIDLPLDELAGMLALCRGYVGNDNGISHLAAAIGAPTVVIFVSTSATNWAPLGPQVHVLHATGQRSQIGKILSLVGG